MSTVYKFMWALVPTELDKGFLKVQISHSMMQRVIANRKKIHLSPMIQLYS